MTREDLLDEAAKLRLFVGTASESGDKLYYSYYVDANWTLLAKHKYHKMDSTATLRGAEIGMYRLFLAELLESEAQQL
jgi:hypothetical protein